MADFCKIYHNFLFGKEVLDDSNLIDIKKEAISCSTGKCITGFLCEGCGKEFLVARNSDSMLVVCERNEDGEYYTQDQVSIEQWEQMCIEKTEQHSINNESDFIPED